MSIVIPITAYYIVFVRIISGRYVARKACNTSSGSSSKTLQRSLNPIWDLLLKRAGEKVRGAADEVTAVACLRK